jgi:hypothetical protein
VDHGQERLRQRVERLAPLRADAAVLRFVFHVAPAVLELRDVGARDEGLVARPAQDDDADGVVGGQLLDVAGHELPGLDADGVALVGPVEDEPAYGSVLLHQQRRFTHGCSPLSDIAPILPDRESKIKSCCMLDPMNAGHMSRRGFLAIGMVGLLGTSAAAAGKPAVTVYKEPT